MAAYTSHAPIDEAIDAAQPPRDVVREQLRRILAEPTFQASGPRRALLRFVVEETLAGRAERLKGFTIAQAVFDRDDDFDPQTDPVVRVEARRLRRDLDGYYAGPGRSDQLVISIPKGGYLPRFDTREIEADGVAGATGSSTAMSGVSRTAFLGELTRSGQLHARFGWATACLLALLLLVAIAMGIHQPRQSGEEAAGSLRLPSVLVRPFRAADRSVSTGILADGITNELVSNLMRFPDFRLYLAPLGRDERDAADVDRRVAEEVSYLVSGEMVLDDGQFRLSAHLVDVASGRVLWSETYARDLTTMNLVELQADLAGEIASTLGQPYGVVRNDILARVGTYVPTELESYYCVLRAYQHRRSLDERERGVVRACIEAAVRRDPAYAEAWAMLAWHHLDEARFPAAKSPDAAERAYTLAFSAASKALALDPENVQALKSLSAIHHYRGNYEEGWRLARLALERNPHDPDTLAQLGWRLAIRGRFEEGEVLLRRAIDRTISPPGWYYHLITLEHMMRGEYAEMLATAQLGAASGGSMAHSFVAVAEANLGRPEAARAALLRMAEASPAWAADPAANFRIHGATDEIVEALMSGLRRAGWHGAKAAAMPEGAMAPVVR